MSEKNGKATPDKILLAVTSHSEMLHRIVVDSIVSAIRYTDAMYPLAEVHLRWGGRGMIDRVRQQVHEYAFENSYDYIQWWDDDMIAPPDIIARLHKHDKPVVAPMAFVRTEPFGMYAYRCVDGNFDRQKSFHHYPIKHANTGLMEVDGTGTGCMLMKTDVVQELDKPWWQWPKEGSEDIALCARLRKRGIKVYVDTDIEVGHVGFTPQVVDKSWHINWIENAKKQIALNPKIKEHPDFGQLQEMIDGAQ